ncbi:MAG TPA: hypothetical protein VHC86_09240 [Opitutaceae bacterium]|nr:hypothetical protein [Opitutaceae bacterium]
MPSLTSWRPRRRLSLALLSACVLAAPGRGDPAAAAPRPLFYRFSLAPRSMQADPLLDVTIMTDVTDAGRKLPKATAGRPAYYLAHSEGFRELGEGIPTGRTLSEEDMARLLQRSLGEGGYLEAQSAKRAPSLLILYSWGLFSRELDYGQGRSSRDTREMLDRAALIGGEDFRHKLYTMLLYQEDMRMGIGQIAAVSGILDPMHLYKLESTTHERMLEMAKSDLYFVIASAYDFRAYQRRQRVLLWRTRIVIDANGVSQPQVLPTMVLDGSKYFGRETHGEPVVVTQHALGKVEIGPIKVVQFGAPGPAAPAR